MGVTPRLDAHAGRAAAQCETTADQAEADESRQPKREARERQCAAVHLRDRAEHATVFACFAFGGATFVVAPWTPALGCVVPATLMLPVVLELDETLVCVDALTCTDADVPALADVVQACVPFLTAWTSGACVEPGHATLCGWLLPGP